MTRDMVRLKRSKCGCLIMENLFDFRFQNVRMFVEVANTLLLKMKFYLFRIVYTWVDGYNQFYRKLLVTKFYLVCYVKILKTGS